MSLERERVSAAAAASTAWADRLCLTEDRLTALEIKLSFTEDLVDQLNDVIVRQQQQIEQLCREVADLRQRPDDGTPVPFRSLRDEMPPHY
jgi:SlyX protein